MRRVFVSLVEKAHDVVDTSIALRGQQVQSKPVLGHRQISCVVELSISVLKAASWKRPTRIVSRKVSAPERTRRCCCSTGREQGNHCSNMMC